MTYQETVNYLYNCVPMLQKIGAGGYKEGLSNTFMLDEHFGHPHKMFKTIHVAGTNGKGTCSHTIAAILQEAGYLVGLYTSPHLVDFRERIRINGKPIDKDYVVRFVEKEREFFEPLHPSFFELTTALAFKYFSEKQVDVALIEVGLGGRLDCTNIITPILSIITNISFDHTQFLGHTLGKIASEKAGIIKNGVPAVVGETVEETKRVFLSKAQEARTSILFAENEAEVISSQADYLNGGREYETRSFGKIKGQLGGLCQEKNTNTILKALPLIKLAGFTFSDFDIRQGFAHVCELTGLMGRWQKLGNKPDVVCDTGHNEGGFRYIAKQLEAQQGRIKGKLRIVFGMVNDKDISMVLSMLPTTATYYFTKASIARALDEMKLAAKASGFGLAGKTFSTIVEAYNAAIADSDEGDFIFVGGSSYVVADLLAKLSEGGSY